eukprot:1596022-Pleurochrysis_carterae.AAC.1
MVIIGSPGYTIRRDSRLENCFCDRFELVPSRCQLPHRPAALPLNAAHWFARASTKNQRCL